MAESYSTEQAPTRALVIHPHWKERYKGGPARDSSALLDEAVGLAEAINLDIVQALNFKLKAINPKTLLGPGQVNHCKILAAEHDTTVAIVNAALSPTQQRNLERAMKVKVLDRTALILEIFGERAQTAEGKMQVELAALNYQKSRLVRSWTHLERQRGGFGFMGGPGESQIETDRRLIADRITAIKKQLGTVIRTRELHRKQRRDVPFPLVALVGYTNAGKSTLFNRLTNAKVMAEDQLFATLDPTIRSITLPSGQTVLLSDTVGFISDLPHELVAAFRATLEEVIEADLLLHVRDISHPDTAAQLADVESVLEELLGEDWQDTPKIEVWNKIDQADATTMPQHADGTTACVSALTGDGCDALLATIEAALKEAMFVTHDYSLALSDGKAFAWLHAHGQVLEHHIDHDTQHVTASLRPADAAKFERMFKH